ncbi:hypothetical protein ACLIBG_04540 [Virgibacillus sp. W0181]
MDMFTDFKIFELQLNRHLDEREEQFLQWINGRYLEEINDPCDQKVV